MTFYNKTIKFIKLPVNENSQLLTLQQIKCEYQRISFDDSEEGLSAFMSIPTEPYTVVHTSYEDESVIIEEEQTVTEDIITQDEDGNDVVETIEKVIVVPTTHTEQKEIKQEEDGEVRKHTIVYVTEVNATLLPYQKLVNSFTANEDGTYNCTQSIVHMTDEEIYNLRKREYITTDRLKAAIENEALFDGVEPDYTEWINAVQAVKEKYPKQNEVG